ncbi:hypothetical protein [Streptacidiphilus sp. EB129]|uniref:LppU/SCO3897 family protein n=1 Tax=Streptacidiphilus sp. EB129 TaxID=3156262 RepID=UPI00351131D5
MPRTVLAVLLGLVVVFAAGYGGAHLAAQRVAPAPNPPLSAPRQGDCVTQQGVPRAGGTARVVACTDAAAQYEITQVFPHTGDLDTCADVDGTRFAFTQRQNPTAPVNLLCTVLKREQVVNRGP